MKYKCIEGFILLVCDDNGRETDETFVVNKDSIWTLCEDKTRLIDGEIRMESDDGWIEISKETFINNFEEENNERYIR